MRSALISKRSAIKSLRVQTALDRQHRKNIARTHQMLGFNLAGEMADVDEINNLCTDDDEHDMENLMISRWQKRGG